MNVASSATPERGDDLGAMAQGQSDEERRAVEREKDRVRFLFPDGWVPCCWYALFTALSLGPACILLSGNPRWEPQPVVTQSEASRYFMDRSSVVFLRGVAGWTSIVESKKSLPAG